MRAGKLSKRVELYTPTGLSTLAWADVEATTTRADVSTDTLRSGIRVVIRMRRRSDIQRNWLVRYEGQWFVVEFVDFGQSRDSVVLVAEVLTGSAGLYCPKTGPNYPIFVSVGKNAPYIGQDGQLLDYRNRLEVLAAQFKKPFQWGDRIEVDGVTYTLRGIADGGDDGVIIQLMG